jgi:hypothetical protein
VKAVTVGICTLVDYCVWLKDHQQGSNKPAIEQHFRKLRLLRQNWKVGYGIIGTCYKFEKRSTIKSQVLADFIKHWTEPSSYTDGTVIDTPWQVHYDIA